MNAEEARAILERGGERTDRQRRGVGAEDRVLADDVLRPADHLLLDLAILEHCLDDQLAIFQRNVVRSGLDAFQERIAFGRVGAPALDLFVHQRLRMHLALRGGFRVAIDQHDIEAGERTHIGDAAAHEAGAEHADLLEGLARHSRWPAGAFVDLLQ